MNILISIPHEFMNLHEWDWPGVTANSMPEPNVNAWILDPMTPITEHLIIRKANLEVIVTASTGTNHIPMELCEKADIDVLSLLDDRRGLNEITASSEFTFLLLLATLRNLNIGLEEARCRRWHRNEWLFRGNELKGKSIGIIGHGRIGRNIYKWCKAFDCGDIYIVDPAIEGTTLEELFTKSDVVVVSCALNETTAGLITREMLLLMKQGACLINTSRGEVIDEEGLTSALWMRPDLRAGIDVLRGEANGAHLASPLLDMGSRLIVTPHMAGTTVESQEKAARIACGLLWRWYGLKSEELE